MKGEIVYLMDPMKSKIQRFIGKEAGPRTSPREGAARRRNEGFTV